MANISAEKHKFSLKLLIDEEKNRVVLAEAGKDFVDVLCSLLTLPMGTIVRLLDKHQTPPQSPFVGCFHNLYKSVSDMSVDNFENQACKNLLLYPRSIKEAYCRKLKLNVDDTEPTKFFVCPNFLSSESCCKVYSNIGASKCSSCGRSMNHEAHVQEGELGDGVFTCCRTSFIITDDLRVALNSMGLVLNVLNDLGYDGFDKLHEMILDVGFEEVITLLGFLFISEAPLTDTFLKKHCMTRKHKVSTPPVLEDMVVGDADKLLTVKVYVRKTDSTVLYAECREDFVDVLFTFLAIPLEFAWELSIGNVNMEGCVGNLCRSVKDLSFEKKKEDTTSTCVLPCFYSFRTHLLDFDIHKGEELECLVSPGYPRSHAMFSRKIKKNVLYFGERIVKFTLMDQNSIIGSSSYGGVGFVKGETSFIVSYDLFITPMSSSSTISLLSKMQLNISDIEEEVINISKREAISLDHD